MPVHARPCPSTGAHAHPPALHAHPPAGPCPSTGGSMPIHRRLHAHPPAAPCPSTGGSMPIHRRVHAHPPALHAHPPALHAHPPAGPCPSTGGSMPIKLFRVLSLLPHDLLSHDCGNMYNLQPVFLKVVTTVPQVAGYCFNPTVEIITSSFIGLVG